MTHDTLSSGNATPTSTGMMGGYPSTTNAYTFITDSDIQSRFRERRMPEDASEVRGTEVELGLRQENFTQTRDDVYAVRWTGGGGFGDPMERDPEAIQRDLDGYCVTEDTARAVYGAVLDAEGQVDPVATQKHREEIRMERVQRADVRATRRAGDPVVEVNPALSVKRDGDGDFWACASCSAELGPRDANYKERCIEERNPVEQSNPLVGDPLRFIDERVEFRQYFCPGCGRLVENEIAVESDGILIDTELPAGGSEEP